MRKMTGMLLALALAGCATQSAPPQVPDSGPEVYRLIAAENQGLPQQISFGEHADREILRGQLLLNRDGTFHMSLTVRAQMTAAEPLTFERGYSGTYSRNPSGLTLHWLDGTSVPSPYVGKALKVYRGGVEYLFVP